MQHRHQQSSYKKPVDAKTSDEHPCLAHLEVVQQHLQLCAAEVCLFLQVLQNFAAPGRFLGCTGTSSTCERQKLVNQGLLLLLLLLLLRVLQSSAMQLQDWSDVWLLDLLCHFAVMLQGNKKRCLQL
jgi:hypothetical protein